MLLKGKTSIGFIIILVVLGFFTTSGTAEAGTIYNCKVVAAGPYGNNTLVYFRLTDLADDPSFTNKFFQAAAGRENQMLAVALTAISSGMKISIITNLADGQRYPVITRMYLLND